MDRPAAAIVVLIITGELGFVLPGSMTSPLYQVAEDFWRWRLEDSPELATSVGVHDYNDRLETFTREAFRKRKKRCEEFLRQLDNLEPWKLSEHDRFQKTLLRDFIQTYVDGYRWELYGNLNPINFLEGVHKDYSFWLDAMRFEKPEDFKTYMKRLRALVTQIHEQIALMREAIRRGTTNHRVSMTAVPEKIAEIDKHPRWTPFFRPFNDSLKSLNVSSGRKEMFSSEGESVIHDQVLPAYRKLNSFLLQEYIPNTRPKIGISSLPDGYEYYKQCLRWHLSLDITPEELHRIGKTQVDRIHRQMQQIKNAAGYSGTLKSFISHMRNGRRFFFKTERELLKGFREIVHKKIPPRLFHLFQKINILPISVQPMPFDGPSAIAMSPTEEAGGILFVNLRNPKTRPKWRMLSLSLHESSPGHHLQSCYTMNQSLPDYRRNMDYRKLFSIPFQFPFQSAYTEGWAVYAETLGVEMGLYTDPHDRFGQLSSELFKTCRLIVDTGIHAFSWSREYSIRFMMETTGVPRTQAQVEVDRYITWPGQALSYIIGYMKIKELRQRAEKAFGPQFEIQDFHHQVLRMGPVPLHVLDKSINQWIARAAPGRGTRLSAHPCLLAVVILTFFPRTLRPDAFGLG